MPDEKTDQTGASNEELQRQNLALRREIDRLIASREYLWTLFVEASRRLQVSSASIKAAVSSLLNYEIFWDPGNQHEFLQTIDASVDKAARLVLILTLAFRAEAGSLELKPEPQSFQEILAVVQANAAAKFPKLLVKFTLPKEGKPVLVDYEYLTLAFGFLFELLEAGQKTRKVQVLALEQEQSWYLDISGVDEFELNLIKTMRSCRTDASIASKYNLLAEHILGLHVACEIFSLQEIKMKVAANADGAPILRLEVPAFASSSVVT
jgi:K+-sensing histidine kinase KdpD